MAKPKHSIVRDSVFRSTGSPAADAPAQGLPVEEKPNHQTAVWLGDDEVEWLDNQRLIIQRGGWRGITRSALIRSVIRAAMHTQVNLGGVSGENELTQRLVSSKPS